MTIDYEFSFGQIVRVTPDGCHHEIKEPFTGTIRAAVSYQDKTDETHYLVQAAGVDVDVAPWVPEGMIIAL